MPQMYPLMWLILFLTFSFLMIMTYSKMFFTNQTKMTNFNQPDWKVNKSNLLWKW